MHLKLGTEWFENAGEIMPIKFTFWQQYLWSFPSWYSTHYILQCFDWSKYLFAYEELCISGHILTGVDDSKK